MPKDEDDYYEASNLNGSDSDDDSDDDVKDTEDGGAIVKLDETEGIGNSKFYANLAEDMEERELSEIGRILCDLISKDKEARKKRDEQYEEGIRRTGLGEDAPGGASFQGASKVVHPMLTEACVDFSARVMKEIFPANGPAKAFIPGDPTEHDIERGKRLADYLNYQCTVQIAEMRAECEQMTTQLPMGGGQYIKLSWHERKKRPNVLFVPIDDIYLPYAATNFYTAERKTHVQYLTSLEYQTRVDNGMYRDVDTILDPMAPEQSKSGEATDKIEGREHTSYNEDGLRTVFECYCMYEIEKKKGVAPYIISIDKNTTKVLSIYRNWDEEDEKMDEMDWIVEFPFVPWRGAYPIGLVHMIGGLCGAATGALRALMDSAHINNFPGLMKLKGAVGGETERIDPTQVMEIEGSIQDDDVRKLIMPMPYNPPSPVLYELLGFLVDAGKNIIRTTTEEMADNSTEVPVGTTMARLEQGMMVFSAIHGRMHDAMGRVLKVLYRINKFYLEEDDVYDDTGKLLVRRKDFEGPMTVVPVSDPNIFSESQRFAQIQLVAQRAQMYPQLYDLRKVEELILERMKIPNVENLLLPKQEAQETNAVNENLAALMGRPIVAYPEQDHMSHMQVHLDFMTNPMLGMNQGIAPRALPLLMDHLNEHIGLWYATEIFNIATDAAGVDISELQRKSDKEEKKKFDKMMAVASQLVAPTVSSQFQNVPPILQQCQQLLQQLQPQPQDPATQLGYAQLQADKEMNQQKISADQQKAAMQAQIEQMKLEHQKEIEGLKAQLKGQELQVKGQTEATKIQTQREIEGAKLTEQSRQADQVIEMESMKQQEENKRTSAELQTQIILAEKKFAQDAQLKQLEGAQQAQLAQQTHEQTKEQKVLDTHATAQLAQQSHEQAKEQKMMDIASSHSMEQGKQEHAKEMEDKKAESTMNMEHLKQASTHALEKGKQDHALDLQRKKDTMEAYKHGGQIESQERIKHAELSHQKEEGKATREHAHKLEQEKAKATEKIEGKKAEHDMSKTKMVETNKSKVADKQLKLKEKEGKEQLKIKQEESKHGMSLKEEEHGMKLQFKEAEGKIGLQAKSEKAKLESQYSKEEHKGKLGLLKTKTKLTEAQLKEKAKMQSESMKQKAKESMQSKEKKDGNKT